MYFICRHTFPQNLFIPIIQYHYLHHAMQCSHERNMKIISQNEDIYITFTTTSHSKNGWMFQMMGHLYHTYSKSRILSLSFVQLKDSCYRGGSWGKWSFPLCSCFFPAAL